MYWVGETVLLLSVCFFGLYRRTPWSARAGVIVFFAGVQSLISWSYSPDMFRYSDELQHLRSLLSILQTDHLFGVNYSLPISPQYPGLESATAAVAETTHLSPFVSGVLVVGMAHLLLTASLLLLFRRVSGSERAAAAAALIYTLGTDQAIIRLFVYEALAMPFLVLALFLAVSAASSRSHVERSPTRARIPWARPLLSLACVAVVTVTHPVTAIALVALLVFLGAGLVLGHGERAERRRVLVLAAASLVLVSLWIGLVSSATLSYLGAPLYDAAYGLFSGGGAGAHAASGVQSGRFEQILTLSGPALTAVLVLIGIGYSLFRGRVTGSVIGLVWVVGSMAYFVVVVVRVFAAGGVELAGRSLAYTSLFSALVVGTVISHLAVGRPSSGMWALPGAKHRKAKVPRFRPSPIWRVTAVAAVLVLGISGLTSAIPAAYERLPGRFHPDAFESGVDQQNVAAARWSASALGSGNPMFGDFTASTLWGTLGDQDGSRTSIDMRRQFEAPHLSPKLRKAARYLDIRFIVSDARIARLLPVTGSYFAAGTEPGGRPRRAPLPTSSMTKFSRIPGVARVYDNGNVRVYDLWGSSYAP
jgi:hypothetical protein